MKTYEIKDDELTINDCLKMIYDNNITRCGIGVIQPAATSQELPSKLEIVQCKCGPRPTRVIKKSDFLDWLNGRESAKMHQKN